MPGFPPLEEPLTDGVVLLREWRDEDRDALVEMANDETVQRWTRVPVPYTRDDADHWFALTRTTRAAGHEAAFAITDAATGEILGSVDLRVHPSDPAIGELGYMVGPRARRRRVATRAVGLLTRWAFGALAIERLEILVDPRNRPSVLVAEAAGFTREGVLRSYRPSRNGGRLDLAIYARLPGEGEAGDATSG